MKNLKPMTKMWIAIIAIISVITTYCAIYQPKGGIWLIVCLIVVGFAANTIYSIKHKE